MNNIGRELEEIATNTATTIFAYTPFINARNILNVLTFHSMETNVLDQMAFKCIEKMLSLAFDKTLNN